MDGTTPSGGGRHGPKVPAIGLLSAALLGLGGATGAEDSDPRTLVQVKRHLARIGVELHRYREDHGRKFPPAAIRGPDRKPLLSWRVALLPLLGEGDLYAQFHLDEPWDSPANRRLLEKMPAVYAPFGPMSNPPGSTFFQVIVGPGTLFEDEGGHDPRAIGDAADATLLVVEAAEAVPWTKPSDLVYDPAGPPPKLGGHFDDGSLALFADGTVAFLRAGIDEDSIRAFCTRNGSEAITRRMLRKYVVQVRRP